MSFIQVAEQRLKLKTGKDVELSPQQMLSCNYLNEGCEGGWAIFNGYLAESGHLVSEDCGPYKGTTNADSCKFYEKCDPVAKVEKSYFLDTSTAESSINEKKIQKEILHGGAVVAEFKAPQRFRYYDFGVLIDEAKPAGSTLLQLDESAGLEQGAELAAEASAQLGIAT